MSSLPKLAPYTGPDRRKAPRDDDPNAPVYVRVARRIQMNLRTMRRIIAEGHMDRTRSGHDGPAA